MPCTEKNQSTRRYQTQAQEIKSFTENMDSRCDEHEDMSGLEDREGVCNRYLKNNKRT